MLVSPYSSVVEGAFIKLLSDHRAPLFLPRLFDGYTTKYYTKQNEEIVRIDNIIVLVVVVFISRRIALCKK